MLDFTWFFNAQAGGYELGNSLRFRGNQKLQRTFGSDNSNANFVISFWCKRAQLGAYNSFIAAQTNAANYEHWMWYDNDSIGSSNGVSGTANNNKSTALFRDPSAWYHVVWKNVASGATTVYINNTQVLSFTRQHKAVNKNVNHNIGVGADSASFKANFYLAEYHLVDGTALDPTEFGEFNADGVWVPKKVEGLTYGTNGFYLDFSDPANIGADRSGNGNNFTPTGFELTNTTSTSYDWTTDSPTNNHGTWNPLVTGSQRPTALSNANLKATLSPLATGTPANPVYCTIAIPTSGRYYLEWTSSGAINYAVKINTTDKSEGSSGNGYWGYAYLYQSGYPSNGGGPSLRAPATATNTGSLSWFASGTVHGIEFDMDNNTLRYTQNGTLFLTQSNCNFADFDRFWFSMGTATNGISGSSPNINTGQLPFQYQPAGFEPLSTAALPAVTVKNPSDHFNTVIYTGSGGSQSLTGLGFQPDLVWIKARSTASSHGWYDSMRGVGKVLQSNTTTAEQDYGSYGVTSFDADGFSVNDLPGYGVNDSGVTYAAWCWKAGGAPVANNAGSISSQVSANPTAGFSIGTYTADGSNANRTVGHGLGVAPEFIIVRNRDTTGRHWLIWHKGFNDNDKALLFTTAAVADDRFGPSAPTSTVFGLYGGQGNYNSDDHVFYAFAGVEGFSKFGSYVGTGSADGPVVWCGFKPRWIMIKAIVTGEWQIVDTERSPYNPTQSTQTLEAQDAGAESNFTSRYWNGDILSNGWKYRGVQYYNASGRQYIYCAFAEHPLGGSNVSPATAR